MPSRVEGKSRSMQILVPLRAEIPALLEQLAKGGAW